MRRARGILLLTVLALGSLAAEAESSQLTVSPAVVAPGESIIITVAGQPGDTYTLGASTSGSGFLLNGVPTELGLDVTIVSTGQLDSQGLARVPYTPPFSGPSPGRMYFQAITSPSPDFWPLYLGPGQSVANLDALTAQARTSILGATNQFTGANTFAQGLSANNARVTDVGAAVSATDGVNKAYADSGDVAARGYADAGDAAVRAYADAGDVADRAYTDAAIAGLPPHVAPPILAAPSSVQVISSSNPSIYIRQTGSADRLLSASVNSSSIPGTGGAAINDEQFVVRSDGGMVAKGQITLGIIPASGPGSRMMWHPSKVAFRAGYADVGGQFDDPNVGYYSWAGGALNTASGNYSFAMGNQNLAAAQCSVALGSGNEALASGGDIATCGIALGLNNSVRDQAGVALGQGNVSDGDSAIALGYITSATADYSMAFGYRADASHTGAKVFGDVSTVDHLESVANNEFAVRAAGGFRFRTSADLTTGCNLPAGTGVFSCTSSKALKTNFGDVDGETLLASVRRVPVMSWSYTAEGSAVRHLGPFAEDFHDAFGLGSEATSIGLLDIDGVNFAGVKALEQRTRELQEALVERDARTAALEERIRQLEALLTTVVTAKQ